MSTRPGGGGSSSGTGGFDGTGGGGATDNTSTSSSGSAHDPGNDTDEEINSGLVGVVSCAASGGRSSAPGGLAAWLVGLMLLGRRGSRPRARRASDRCPFLPFK